MKTYQTQGCHYNGHLLHCIAHHPIELLRIYLFLLDDNRLDLLFGLLDDGRDVPAVGEEFPYHRSEPYSRLLLFPSFLGLLLLLLDLLEKLLLIVF